MIKPKLTVFLCNDNKDIKMRIKFGFVTDISIISNLNKHVFDNGDEEVTVRMMGSCCIHMNYEIKPLYNPHA